MTDEFTATKQLGFIFRADNCIGCHSCEAACSEKNGLPSHIAWRTVGFIEGGTFPNHTRINTSMACNHCDDPICLKGCPTGAYVKYQDTGAVVVDSDICFGCRYCTWVCPYEAPSFNPDTGSVSKCNMCVDRLAENLQPACVDACLGHALEFGEIRQYEQDHPDAVRHIAGFPDPCITKPNIRFQQHRALPATMQRTDAEPIRYQASRTLSPPDHRHGNGSTIHSDSEESMPFHSTGAKGMSTTRQEPGHAFGPANETEPWSSLHSHETSLVAFTLLTQCAVGAFLALWSLPLAAQDTDGAGTGGTIQAILVGLTGLLAVGFGISTAHLGKPWRCYRSLNNLRYSWVSREILAIGLFFSGLSLFTALTVAGMTGPSVQWGLGSLVGILGLVSILTMSKIYMIPGRPFWNHTHTWVSFYASVFVLGPYLVAAGLGLFTPIPITFLVSMMAVALTAQLAWHRSQRSHIRDLASSNWAGDGRGSTPFGPLRTQAQTAIHVRGEAEASLDRLFGTFGRFHRIRNRLSVLTMGISAATLAAIIATEAFWSGMTGIMNSLVPWIILLLFVTATAGELIGRALFYSAVTPTTMPGSLFINNRDFEKVARDTGLTHDQMAGIHPH